MAFSDWSSVDADNATSSGVNIGEGCPPSNVNNAIRRIMAQLRAAFNPILDAFFASTTLEQARTALGVSGGSTSNNNFAALTNTASKVPFMTGSDAWDTFTATSFMRGVMASGDGPAAMTALSGVGSPDAVLSVPGYIKLNISGAIFIIQWVDATIGASTTTGVSFPVPFTSFCRAWTGGPLLVSGVSTTAASITNAAGSPVSTTVFAWGV